MHPTIENGITRARLAHRQRQAGQAAIDRPARRACPAPASPPTYPPAGLAGRVLSLVAARAHGAGRPWPQLAGPPPGPCADCV
jgi:hypothetical protein